MSVRVFARVACTRQRIWLNNPRGPVAQSDWSSGFPKEKSPHAFERCRLGRNLPAGTGRLLPPSRPIGQGESNDDEKVVCCAACALRQRQRACCSPAVMGGELVTPIKSDKEIVFGDVINGKQVYFAFKTVHPIKVRDDREGWLRVSNGEREGWVDKADFILSRDGPAYFRGRVLANPKDEFA